MKSLIILLIILTTACAPKITQQSASNSSKIRVDTELRKITLGGSNLNLWTNYSMLQSMQDTTIIIKSEDNRHHFTIQKIGTDFSFNSVLKPFTYKERDSSRVEEKESLEVATITKRKTFKEVLADIWDGMRNIIIILVVGVIIFLYFYFKK